VTDQTARTPYCRKIRYGITGAPILTEDEMDGSHAPGVGMEPRLIELVYSSARDGKPASVSASVTGWWTRFGRREQPEDQMTTHFKNGPDGWPDWLVGEARLHDPAAVVPPAVDRAALRDRIAEGLLDHLSRTADIRRGDDGELAFMPVVTETERMRLADAVLAVLPATTDRAAEVAKHVTRAIFALKSPVPPGSEHYRSGWDDGLEAAMDAARDAVLSVLRRMADETPQSVAETEFTEARAAFMQIGRTPSLEGLRAELRIEGWPPIVGRYCGASMGRMHDVPGHEHLLAVDPRLIFEYADEQPAAVAQPDEEAEGPRTVCVCGHTRGEHITVSGRLLCDTCNPDSTDNLVCKEFEAL
jgi:hypothetical protein